MDLKYSIQLISVGEKKEIYNFIREHFIKDEPLNHYLRLTDFPEKENDCILNCIAESNCSFKAVNDNGEIIGVVINEIVKNEESVLMSSPTSYEHEGLAIDLLLYHMEDKIQPMLKKYQNIIDLKLLAVHRNFRGNGISNLLLQKTKILMKSRSLTAMKSVCTSAYSAMVMEKFNMKMIHQLAYKNFLDENGKILLHPAAPHTHCSAYLMEI